MMDMLVGERVPFNLQRSFWQNALAPRTVPPLLEHRVPYEGQSKAE
jgi:hypothetical protein